MSIVHVDKIWVEITNKMRRGGIGVVNDFGHPRTRGEGGSKKDKFLRTSFMDGPFKGPSIKDIHSLNFNNIMF